MYTLIYLTFLTIYRNITVLLYNILFSGLFIVKIDIKMFFSIRYLGQVYSVLL